MSVFLNPMVAGRFSIIIPHWNGKQHLEVCLSALRAQTYPDIEIIIADNASEDGSQDYIRENFPECIIEQLPENRGFTGACNAGMRIATGEYICLLNNDTEVDHQWVSELIAAFKKYPDVGFLASRMMLFDRRDHFHTTGDFYRVDGMPGNRGVWEKDTGQYDKPEYMFSACGGSSVYRRNMLEEVGLLDDDFFFSCEDLDLAWRAQMMGYQCLYVPTAIVYHKLSASGGGVTASFHDGRNHLYLLFKDYPRELWKKYKWAILRNQFKNAWAALRSWRGKAARAKLRGMLAGLHTARKMLRKRRAIHNTRRVSIEYLESILTPLNGQLHPRYPIEPQPSVDIAQGDYRVEF
jgi:GT2 family glycosyltransferase